MITGTTVAITKTTKESDDKSQIRSMGTDKINPAFLISDPSPQAYFNITVISTSTNIIAFLLLLLSFLLYLASYINHHFSTLLFFSKKQVKLILIQLDMLSESQFSHHSPKQIKL